MIENIKDSRKRPHHWKRINAIVEPTWHDNENWPDRDQSERGPDDLANQYNDTLLSVAVALGLQDSEVA
jgi:hypothetical protein